MSWDPWAEAERRRHVTVEVHPIADVLGGGLTYRRDGQVRIVLSPSLSPAQQRAVLTHELIHDERGTPCDHPGAHPRWAPCVEREERRVRLETARRLADDPWFAQWGERWAAAADPP